MRGTRLIVWLPALVLGKSVDYIVVGAGPAGLVIANRLSEDPNVTVAVIEPGGDERNNPLVSNTAIWDGAHSTHVDWNYTGIPQESLDGRELLMHSGRAWGGSSTINGMTYIRANKEEIDAWELLGNKGWTWKALLPYYRKAEKYFIPTRDQVSIGATYQPKHHSFKGPLHVGYSRDLVRTSSGPRIIKAWESLGVPLNPDFNSGDIRGVAIGPQTLDPPSDIRWDAARAYVSSIEERKNLKILRGTVRKILWSKISKKGPAHRSKLHAQGIEFLAPGGKLKNLSAKKEVIISAGGLRTPGILEASGIGNPTILEAHGIETLFPLPGVGENLMEQPNVLVGYVSTGALTPSRNAWTAYLTAAQIYGDDFKAVSEHVANSLPAWAQEVADTSHFLNATALEHIFRVQYDLLFRHNVPASEHLAIMANWEGTPLEGTNFWTLHLFSRGSVHLRGMDVGDIDRPLIDHRLLHLEFDMDMTIRAGRATRDFWHSAELEKTIVAPGNQFPDEKNSSDEAWAEFLRGAANVNNHAFGTASMLPQEFGGVVDSRLLVYGTANVRVVDASVIPIQNGGHPTATLYALAERAADIVKGVI